MSATLSPSRWRAWVLFLGLAAGVAALDLWTKDLLFDALQVRSVGNPPMVRDQRPIDVIPGWFQFQATYNRGAFRGWFGEHTGKLALLSAVAVVVIVAILVTSLRRRPLPSAWFVAALGLICGGTLGNLWDRWTLAAVRDWIKWFVVIDGREYVWPNFNIADAAICVGVALLVLLEIVHWARERRKAHEGSPAT